MKKLIVFSVVLALLGTFAFAQANFGAGGSAQATLLQGTNGGDPGVGFDGGWSFNASKTNDEGTAGAKGAIGFSINGADGNAIGFDVYGGTYFYAWWQPIPQVFFKLGKVDEDARYWTGGGITGWGFQSNDLFVDPALAYWNGYAGGFFSSGHGFWGPSWTNRADLQLTIAPVDMIAINLGWCINGDARHAYLETLKAQVVVNIPGAGTAALGFENAPKGDAQSLGLMYAMGLGDNMSFEVGLETYLNSGWSKQIDLGIGFKFDTHDNFWLTARIAGEFHAYSGAPITLGLELCPSFDLGFARIYVPLGFGLRTTELGGFGFRIAPYIVKDLGGISLWAGFRLHNGPAAGSGDVVTKGDGGNQSEVHWAIPITLQWAW